MQKVKLSLVVAVLTILIVPTVMQIAQPAIAQTANDMPVYLKVYAEPNPVGVGQVIYLSLFFTKPIPIVGSAGGGSLYTGLTLDIVKPDGSKTTLGPYTSDTTGGVGGIEFTPDVTGNYTVQAFYKGQTISGRVGGVTLTYNILSTESEVVTFVVQEERITGKPTVPLPQEYWSRPIYATNYIWSQLGGNWWGLGKPSFTDTGGYDASGNNFNPYSKAPNSAHVMWVKPTAFGGQVGSPVSGDQESQYTSTSILYRQFEPIILNGIIYYKVYTNTPTTETSVETPGWNAVDLRTGELLWHKDTKDTLDFGFVMQFHTVQEYGTQAFLVASSKSPSMFSSGTGQWQLFDPMTGYFIANITDVPATTGSGLVETDDNNAQGAVYIYTVNGTYPNLSLTMWNSTRCLQGPRMSSVIRPSGNISYSQGYQWSVAIPSQINGQNITNLQNTLTNPPLNIAGRTNEVILLRSYGESMDTFASEFGEGSEIELGMDAKTGQVLWGPVNRTLPRYHEISVLAAGEGYYIEQDKDTNVAYVYNLNTGQQVGSPVQLVGSALSTLSRGGAIAYGKAYVWDFGGYVNAIDLATGTLAWTYEPRPAGYNTPYGIYPFWHFGSHSIADGKLFLSESRMYDPPIFSDAHKVALNCTDGSVVWMGLGFYGREPSAVADGYLVAWNSYDAQIYTYGKGPTKLTVSAPQTSIEYGKQMIISGTITDISTGTTDADRSARFPNGVGCVSDDSQTEWMAYVYMQQAKPTNATGVPVTLSVVDANGNYRTIGSTTSTTEGYYTYTWTPDISGSYVVYAQYAGSESYWPSTAVSSFVVEEEPQASAQPTQQPVSIADQYFLPGIAAVIVVIVIVGALIILLQRKHP
ncbi:PQQ-binding-like beta-propeller repeat protein [Candidatus Bathyarchaeota archaeon]|nr:PQQ-binding-like beta-propeller repeat protein [Candidatus Bathyarchaeota archaeon]